MQETENPDSGGSNNKDIYYFTLKTFKMDQLQAQHDQGVWLFSWLCPPLYVSLFLWLIIFLIIGWQKQF